MSASARDRVLRIAVPVLSLALFFLLAEVLLQVASPFLKPRFTKVDPDVGWTHYPNVSREMREEDHTYFLSYNSHGYRSPDHAYEKPDGVVRAVFLGDSFTDGAEVGDDEIYTARLQERLGDGFEIINLGVYAYTTAQELITLERDALRYDPDLVVLMTITNDFDANMLTIGDFGASPRFVLDGDGIRLEGTDHPDTRRDFRRTNLPFPGMTWLHRHSHVYYLLNHYIYQRLVAGRIVEIMEAQENALSFPDQVTLYTRMVERMRDTCEAAGAEFWVAFGYLREGLMEDSANFRCVPPLLAAQGIRAFDLYGPLRKAELSGGPSLYYEFDIHWNAAGHDAVAGLLAEPIREWAAELQ